MPRQMSGYSWWSKMRIRSPATATTTMVAVTMTLAAMRTDGGCRMNFDMRRSIGFRRGIASAPRRAAARLHRRRVSFSGSVDIGVPPAMTPPAVAEPRGCRGGGDDQQEQERGYPATSFELGS